jgi:hypothetical protein
MLDQGSGPKGLKFGQKLAKFINFALLTRKTPFLENPSTVRMNDYFSAGLSASEPQKPQGAQEPQEPQEPQESLWSLGSLGSHGAPEVFEIRNPRTTPKHTGRPIKNTIQTGPTPR